MPRFPLSFAGLFVVLALSRASAADDVREAAQHFQRGTEAHRAHDLRRAAEEFDAAYAAAPHHDALWNAAQEWEAAGDVARAANRYAAYLRRAPANARDRGQATSALATLAKKLGRIHLVVAALDEAKIDGEPVTADVVYAYPGTHVVAFRGSEREVAVGAGEDRSVSFGSTEPPAVSPSPSPEPPSVAPAPVPAPAPPTPPEHGARRLPPWVAIAGGALAVVAAGGATFFGVRSLDRKHAFDRHSSAALLEGGRNDQTLANVGIGVSVGLAAVSAALALFFVDWRSR